jgi:Domain of Unknown Function (DUF1080)
MKKLILLCCAGTLFMASTPVPKHNNKKGKWVKLFDGRTTKGWHIYGKDYSGKAWNVQDGALHLDASVKEDKRDLITDKEYGNFHLKIDWKIAPNGNSGIIFLVHEDTAKFHETYVTGPEMQVIDNNGHPDAKNPKHRAGDLYDLIACSKEVAKPAGEWNTSEMILDHGHVTFLLNGTKTVETTMWDDQWSQLVANSKFKSMPAFATFKSGHIALQQHGADVWFKNISIEEL